MTTLLSEFSKADLNDLRVAKSKLEYPGLTARIAKICFVIGFWLQEVD